MPKIIQNIQIKIIDIYEKHEYNKLKSINHTKILGNTLKKESNIDRILQRESL